MNAPQGCECLTPREAAKCLRVSMPTLYRLLKDGAIRHARIRAALRIRREALLAYLDSVSTREWMPGERADRGPAQVAALALRPQAD